MHVVIAYDIVNNRIRSNFHKFLKEFGLNTQKSVFECDLDREGIDKIVACARKIINPATDSVRLYRICAGCQRKVRISGRGIKIVKLDYILL